MIGRTITVALVALGWPAGAMADPGTPEDRSALFDYILEATLERTAFSPFKPRDIGAEQHMTEAEYVRSAMLAHRTEFLAADTDAKLYYALTKLTCARWDAHLSRVRLVEGGIQPFAGRTQTGGAAPMKFKPDYTNKATMFLFVSDFANDIGEPGCSEAGCGRRPASPPRSCSRTCLVPTAVAALWEWSVRGGLVRIEGLASHVSRGIGTSLFTRSAALPPGACNHHPGPNGLVGPLFAHGKHFPAIAQPTHFLHCPRRPCVLTLTLLVGRE